MFVLCLGEVTHLDFCRRTKHGKDEDFQRKALEDLGWGNNFGMAKREIKALEDDPERPLPQKILHHLEEAVVGVRGATKETPADFLNVGVR